MLNFENIITSRQNPTVKDICSLCDKKRRYEDKLFRFDGVKLFCEALRTGVDIRMVVLSENACDSALGTIENALKSGEIDLKRVLYVSESVFSKISEERSPEGIITVAEFIESKHKRLDVDEVKEYSLPEDEQIVIAESVRDAGNLGTLVRTSAALGIDRLIITSDCADIYNSKTIRAAMGGLFTLSVDILPGECLADAIRSLVANGRRIYATALHRDALTVGEFKLEKGDAFVIGNEGHGLSADVIEACSACALIPMKEGSESLNAAVAAAICIWETTQAK